ncbi:hypothetical protein Pan153_24220 [Gimesia panareensis]|uniref:MotA/TolQ/ExbB proton channel domain-containing protein n=1 Tax=Gimesia panareensis TaxID=2527978 RepID=A0A518FN65_9PLAN|nr:MotA/TolQ/ExbB proton channel family protein [Gimesia panareensis]QDV17767.1 hypothetical protein Pan153_24220 [Gimesia panareensis]
MLTLKIGIGYAFLVLTLVGGGFVCLLSLLKFRRPFVLLSGAGAGTGGWVASFLTIMIISWGLTFLFYFFLFVPPSINVISEIRDEFDNVKPIKIGDKTFSVIPQAPPDTNRLEYWIKFTDKDSPPLNLAVIEFLESQNSDRRGRFTTDLRCRVAVPGNGVTWPQKGQSIENEFEYLIADFALYKMMQNEFPTPYTFEIQTPASVHVFEKSLKFVFEYINDETETYEKANYQRDENAERSIVRSLSQIVKVQVGEVPLAIQFSRMINGPIQWCTFWIFFALILVLLGRYATYVLFESTMVPKEVLEEIMKVDVVSTSAVDELAQKARAANEYCINKTSIFGCKTSTAQLELFYEAAAAFRVSGDYKAVPEFVDSRVGTILDERSARQGFLKYLLWAIPSIGFVGTVIGIGGALLNTMNVDAVNPVEAAIAKSMVSSSIGVAFDTTLVALILSLIGMLLFHVIAQLEEALVIDKAADIRRKFIKTGEQFDDENRVKGLVGDLFLQWEKLHNVNEKLKELSTVSTQIDGGYQKLRQALAKQSKLIQKPGKKINTLLTLSLLGLIASLTLVIWKVIDYLDLIPKY